jgi:carboxypeptidase family protein
MPHVRAARKVAVANLLGLIISLIAVANSPARAATQAQPFGAGRIAGRVIDAPQTGVPGVTVTIVPYSMLPDANSGKPLAIDGVRQSVVTDGEGRFVFEDLQSDKTYLVSAHVPGRRTVERWHLDVKDGETVSIELPLSTSARCSSSVDEVSYDELSRLLTPDAVLHVRIREDGISRFVDYGPPDQSFLCGEWDDAPAAVLGVARIGTKWAGSQEILITARGVQLEAGQEYLVFLNYDSKLQRFEVESADLIADRRVSWSNRTLGVRKGMSIEQALRAIREWSARYSRYRTYEDLRSTAPLESLQYGTGWTWIGILHPGDVWDLRDKKRFEFATTPPPNRMVPRVNDRIRMTSDCAITILDYGSKGESLRNVSPTTRRYGGDITSLTGALAQAGHSYRVADVRFKREKDEDYRSVWVRLVAD